MRRKAIWLEVIDLLYLRELGIKYCVRGGSAEQVGRCYVSAGYTVGERWVPSRCALGGHWVSAGWAMGESWISAA